MTTQMLFGLAVFIVVYFCISTDIVNKTIIALLGAAVFIASGILHQEEAFKIVDWNVIFLLLSMMIMVGIVKKTGFSQFVALKLAKLVKASPVKILVLFAILTAVSSAILGTVTTIMLIVPVSILLAVEMDISPIPYLIVEAMAANIGGCATIVGDPTTIMVGSAFNLEFVDYMRKIDPILILLLAVFCVMIVFLFGRHLKVSNERRARILDIDESKAIQDKPLLVKSLLILGLVILGFMTNKYTHLEVATIALLGAATLMVMAGRKEVDHFLHEVEWGTLLFFVGLFILVGGLVEMGVIKLLGEQVVKLTGGNITVTSILIIWASGIISALVDNVPYVATMIPLVQEIVGNASVAPTLDPEVKKTVLWLSLLLGADLGGNGTLVGATANVVAVGLAAKDGFKITFWEFTKYGIIITAVNLTIVTAYIYLAYLR